MSGNKLRKKTAGLEEICVWNFRKWGRDTLLRKWCKIGVCMQALLYFSAQVHRREAYENKGLQSPSPKFMVAVCAGKWVVK